MKSLSSGVATVLGYEKTSQISSQKARGIALISQLGYYSRLPAVIISAEKARELLTSETSEVLKLALETRLLDSCYLMLRTCPLVPRHGILENKRITIGSYAEFQDTLAEFAYSMLEAGESEGDIVIQRFIECKMNLVWSDGHVVIGPGFDGATAGRFPSFGLNVPWPKWLNGTMASHSTQDKNYELEFVIDGDWDTYWTQIREATKHKDKGLIVLPNSLPGFISDPTKPRLGREYNFIKVDGTDLQILEKIKDPNTLVIHEHGNLLSHASAHCRQNGWAYIAKMIDPKEVEDFYVCEPAPGSIMFTKTPAFGTEISVEDYKNQFVEGLEFILSQPVAPPSAWRAFTLSFAFHHFSTKLTFSPEVALLAGIFAGIMLKSSFSIILGEMRHYLSLTSETDGSVAESWELFMSAVAGDLILNDDVHRKEIYQRVFSTDCSKYFERMLALMRICRILYNKVYWGGGYGGVAWGRVTRATIRSILAINTGSIKFILREINLLANAAHNCGWAFNKFTTQADLLYFTQDFLGNLHWPIGLDVALTVLKKSIPKAKKKYPTIFVKENVEEVLFSIAKLLSRPSAEKKAETLKKNKLHVDVSKGYNDVKKTSCYEAVFGKLYSWHENNNIEHKETKGAGGVVIGAVSQDNFHANISILLTHQVDPHITFSLGTAELMVADKGSILFCIHSDFNIKSATANQEMGYKDMSLAYELLQKATESGAENMAELNDPGEEINDKKE